MRVLEKVINTIDNINERIGKICAFSVLLLMLVVVYEVVSRRIFNSPTEWAFETITMIYGFLFMMVAGYGLLKGSIVCVDIFSGRLNEKKQHILSIITYLILFFPFVTLMIPAAINFTVVSWQMKEMSWSQWAPPVYPIKTVIPIALILLWLQGTSELLKSVKFLMNNRKDTGTGGEA